MKVDNKKLSEFLKIIQAPVCPLCGSNNWGASDRIFQLQEFHGGKIIIGGETKIFPVLPLTCEKCGNTYFINAIGAKLIDPNDREANNNDIEN